MTDEAPDHAQGRSRRSAFAKIGAVAAGAWVAPQVLSTQAASAQSAPPCACPVAYANSYSSQTFNPVPSGFPVDFDGDYVSPVGITHPAAFLPFTVASSGIYRVSYTLTSGLAGTFSLVVNGNSVPFGDLALNNNETRTRVVLVAAVAGDQFTIQNTGIVTTVLQAAGAGDPAASILIELVA